MARLLDTKLRPPPLRDERVYRPRLYEDLADFMTGVVLVSAPPGFGKSTLVIEWLTRQNRPFAWYSLDRYDGDVGLFGEYVGAAVGSMIGHNSGLVAMPDAPTPDLRSLVATLVEDLAQAPTGTALVLDDYHEIQSSAVHEAVTYLIENLPDGIILVIVTRADPPLPFSRLRGRGLLREIRGSDLRFTVDQVADYFRSVAGIELDTDQLQLITEKSEGWILALQLVGLGMDRHDPQQLARSLSAGQRHIADYLVDEVLDRLRPEVARFLLESSPFERFDSRLCREAAHVTNADDLIREVERENAFLIPLGPDGEWYRYHHLFADLLRLRHRRVDPGRYSAVLHAAANSCADRGLIDDAVDYALKANDAGLAASILNSNLGAVLGAGEINRLRSWLRLFPVPAGEAASVVALGWAWCRVFEGDMPAAAELIDRIEARHIEDFAQDPRGQLNVMRAMAAFQAGDPTTAESHAQRALDLLPPHSVYMESLAHLYVGRALQARALRVEARPHLERAASLAERGNILAAVSALFSLGVVDMDLGNLVAAERSMARALEVGSTKTGPSGDPHPAAGVGEIGLAFIRLNQLRADEAVDFAERGCRLLKRSNFVEMVFRAYFVWAEALSTSGRFDDAQAAIDDGIHWLQGRAIGGGPLETWLLMAQARNAWRRGNLDESRRTLDQVRRRGLGSPNADEALGFYEAADELSLSLRRGDADAGRRLLASLPPDPTENVMFTIKRHVLTAALHEIEGDSRSAVASLEDAIGLARVGYRFQFSFVGPIIQPVLERMVGRTEHDEFVRSIIELLPPESGRVVEQPIDPLTERELDVLAEIAAGYTNEQIAERLFISRGTVKRHTANIYLKLGAHHRTEAVARGRELGLLD
jgi:LuxR family maltose regulon positive regulatory protein